MASQPFYSYNNRRNSFRKEVKKAFKCCSKTPLSPKATKIRIGVMVTFFTLLVAFGILTLIYYPRTPQVEMTNVIVSDVHVLPPYVVTMEMQVCFIRTAIHHAFMYIFNDAHACITNIIHTHYD